jgi:hypothetical protein
MAQSLGLHQAWTAQERRSPREIEIARRTWHGCVWMDRFGEPTEMVVRQG